MTTRAALTAAALAALLTLLSTTAGARERKPDRERKVERKVERGGLANGTYLAYNASQGGMFSTTVVRNAILESPTISAPQDDGQDLPNETTRVRRGGVWVSRGVQVYCGVARGTEITVSTNCTGRGMIGKPQFVARRVSATIPAGAYSGTFPTAGSATPTLTLTVSGTTVSATTTGSPAGPAGALTFAPQSIGSGGALTLTDATGAYTISGNLYPAGVPGAPSSSGFAVGTIGWNGCPQGDGGCQPSPFTLANGG